MGTEYGFGELGDRQVRLNVYEMSGRFSLYVDIKAEHVAAAKTDLIEPDGAGATIELTNRLEPAALLDAAIKMIQAASYWMHDEEVAAKLPELRQAVPALFRGS